MAHWCWPQFVMTHEMYSTQHITPNSKRLDYSDVPGGGHKKIEGPANMAEGGHHLRQAPPTPHPTPHPHSRLLRSYCYCKHISQRLHSTMSRWYVVYPNTYQNGSLVVTLYCGLAPVVLPMFLKEHIAQPKSKQCKHLGMKFSAYSASVVLWE